MPPIVQTAVVRTNSTPGSIHKIKVEAVQFANLWASYPSENPYVDASGKPPKDFENQCAIKLSAAIHGAGIEMKSFTPANVDVKPGKTIGRIMLSGKFAATRADELASWLKRQPFVGLPQKPENVTGEDFEKKIRGRTGIIFFEDYWMREGETSSNASGDHIDLWNGSRMTFSGAESLLVVIGRRIGISSAHIPGTSIGYSDLAHSKTILFWEIK